MSHTLFWEVHYNLPREGPGNNAATRTAYASLKALPAEPRILDVGCGPGMQTLELASCSAGLITAVDTRESFLQELAKRAAQAGMTERIKPVQASMFSLPFAPESFDLIWSEGAIYIMGFERGLREWRPLLASGGYLVASEATWLRFDPPARLAQFWQEAYPLMTTIEENLRTIEAAGYEVIGHQVLPEAGWWDDYYHPLEARIAELRDTYRNQPELLAELDQHQLEIELYRKYAAYYGYVFYLMRKP